MIQLTNEVLREVFVNKPVEGKENESDLVVVYKEGTKQVYIYDELVNGKQEKLWLDSQTALKLATWILDNVSEN